MFKIEKGMPIPNPAVGRSKYPWEEMEVGDSFFVPGTDRNVLYRLSTNARYHGKRTGKTYTVRTMEDGVRVWRIK